MRGGAIVFGQFFEQRFEVRRAVCAVVHYLVAVFGAQQRHSGTGRPGALFRAAGDVDRVLPRQIRPPRHQPIGQALRGEMG
ncbi:hypothetical protein, partial [Nitratireductor sp. GCM10026969]|uniref:hypothetical protein n=1 Tax=Nitratireductor sp. GCM10026969 TaxID=3252645 RepID=UPI00367206B1